MDHQRQQFRIAASERVLWLSVVSGSQSQFYFREAGGEFDLGRSTRQRLAAGTVYRRDLLVFFDDGAVYRYFPDPARRPMAEAVLPQGQVPLDVVGDDEVVYAIIPSPVAAELPLTTTGDKPPTTRPFEPGEAALSLVRYDGRVWTATAPLPLRAQPAADARLRPRLCLVHEKLWLFTPAQQPGQVLYSQRDAANNQWITGGNVPLPGLTGFWVVNFNNRLTFVGASRGAAGGETIKALHLLGADGQAEPTAARLELSDLPQGVTVARYGGAVGFNQHLGLLAIDANGNAYLRYAHSGGPPVETTFPIDIDALSSRGVAGHTQDLFRLFTFVVLLAVLTGLFVFRRGSMVRVVELPPGCALAFNLQRMSAWLIDFVPFALAAAIMLDVSWAAGLKALFQWGINSAPDRLPEQWQTVFAWWALSVCGHTVYMLVMELLARRTVGKVVARIYLLSESGVRPSVWQVLVRNLTRLIEFTPQFWAFVVLVLLSRNRQRMGDIFARTVTVRLIRARRARPDRTPSGPPDESDSEPARGQPPQAEDGEPRDPESEDSHPPSPSDE